MTATDFVTDASLFVREVNHANGATLATYLVGLRGPEYKRNDDVGQDETPYNSALWIAMRRDMDWDKFLRRGDAEAVFRDLLRAGASQNAVTGQAAVSMTWAERRIACIADAPPVGREEGTSDYNLRDVAGGLENVIQKYGPNGRGTAPRYAGQPESDLRSQAHIETVANSAQFDLLATAQRLYTSSSLRLEISTAVTESSSRRIAVRSSPR